MKLGDLSDVKPWTPGSMPPPGTYTARIENCEEGTSRNNYPQLILSWTVVGGEYDGAEIREWITITEATRGKVVALLQATGVEITPGDFELTPAMLTGKLAEIVVHKEPHHAEEGKMVTKVAGHREPPGAVASSASNGARARAQSADVAPDTEDLPF